jgi:hypothetical protein
VTDSHGNSITCPQTVIVNDTQPPTIACPALVTVIASPGLCGATNVALGTPTASDNCGPVTITNNAPALFPIGTNTVIWTVMDSHGNSVSCPQTVIVKDTQPPTITCPALVTVIASPGLCGAINVALGTPTVSDNCGLVTVSNNAPALFPVGTNTVVWTATDSHGNRVTCPQTVIVNDTQPPTIACPALVTVVASPGLCGATNVALGTPTASDNCGPVTITNNAPALFPVGTNTVIWTVTDSHGNSVTCPQTVVVYDTQPPSITCPALVTVVATPGLCGATNVALGTLTASDNCGPVTITNNAPALFPVGTNTVIWTVTDSHGNSVSCPQTVIVNDTQPPNVFCPALVTVVASPGLCGATNVTLGAPTASDNCGSVTTTNNGPSFFPVGTNTVIWTVTDSHGNSATCPQTVIVIDTEAPTFTKCPANLTLGCNPTGIPDCDLSPNNVAASDNCGTPVMTCSKLDQTNGCIATRRLSYKATDASGNFKVCTQTITWTVDTTAPVLVNCPGPTLHLGCNPTSIPSTNSYAVNAADGCTAFPNITRSQLDRVNGCVYTRTLTWVATDGCGNSASCSQVIDWTVDISPPTLTVPTTGFDLGCNPAVLPTDATVAAQVTATDTCSLVATNVTHLDTTNGCTITRTFTVTATDGCNNTTSKSLAYTWRADRTAPNLVVPNGGNLGCNPTVLPTDATVAAQVTASDACSLVTTNVTHLDTANGCTNIRTFTVTATDGCSNTAGASVVYTWKTDFIAPVLNGCPANASYQHLGDVTAPAQVTAFDNCDGNLVVNLSQTSNGTPCNLTITRTWTATDSCGNSAQCSQTLTVADTIAPTVNILSPPSGSVFITPANFTVLADAQDAGGVAKVEFYSGTDNLGAATSGAPYFVVATNVPVGNYTLLAVATDVCGNAVTSAPVSISILQSLPLTIIAAMQFDPQTGLFEQTVRVTNPTYSTLDAVRVSVYGLTNGATVYNLSGTANGVQYVQSSGPLAAGGYVDFIIEYYVPSRVTPNPTLVALPATPLSRGSAVGAAQHVDRIVLLPDRTVLIEFTSITNRIYSILYGSDLGTWETAVPSITGNGTRIQWIDNGQPKTESSPATASRRFYRLILMP